MWTSGMQVVVLAAGRGSRMTELIGNTVPKCLIPVAGNPLIFYPLKSLAMAGFKDVLVIIQERDDVRKVILKLAEKVGISIEAFGVPEDSEDFGTAESIRLALNAKKISKDVLILSCDVIGKLPIQELLKLHGLKDSAVTSLYMKTLPLPQSRLPGPKSKVKQDRDIIGLTSEKELVFMTSEADLDEELSLPVSTLKKFPSFKLLTLWTDCHLYIIRKKVLERLFDLVEDDQKPLSLKGEFLPWLIESECESKESNPEKIKSFYCHIQDEDFCLRINSLQNYMLACQSTDWLKSLYPDCISRAKETKIAKGCKLVATTLGDHCSVGEKSRLTNVIAMDHVKIESGCELLNVIISSNAQIGEGAVIKDCLVGPKFLVSAGARHTNEHLTVVEETFFEA